MSCGGPRAPNGRIPAVAASVSLPTPADVACLLVNRLQYHRDTLSVWSASCDIEAAFRNLPISPIDLPMMLIQWAGETFIDARVPFGMRSGPAIWEAVAYGVEQIAHSAARPAGS